MKSAMEGTNKATAQLIGTTNGAIVETDALAAAQTSSTLAAKAQASALKAVSIAGNMIAFAVISKGIELAVKGIDNWIHRVEKANEAMDEAVSEYESAKSSLESVNSELEENNNKINELLSKDNLTYVEKGQLKELQEITKELLLQQDIEQRKTEKASKEAAEKAIDAYEKQYGKFDISKEKLNEILESTDSSPISKDDNDVAGNIASYIKLNELLEEARQNYDNAFNNNENTETFANDLLHYQKAVENCSEVLDTNLSDLQEQRLALEDEYKKAVENQQNGTEPLMPSDQEVISTYESIYDAIKMIYEYTDQNAWNDMEIANIFNTDGIEKTKDEFIAMVKAGELTPETITDYKNLNKAIQDSELFFKNGQTAADAFWEGIDRCIKATDEGKYLNQNMGTPFLSTTAILSQIQSLSNGLNQINQIYADVCDKESFDWSSILNNDGFSETFGNMKNVTHEYQNIYAEFIRTISNSPDDIDACQSAFDRLATAYVYNSDALKDVTQETRTATINILKQMGVANAEEVVDYQLAQSEDRLAQAKANLSEMYKTLTQSTGNAEQAKFLEKLDTIDLENATDDEIQSLINEANAFGIGCDALIRFQLEKMAANATPLNTSDDINNLLSLASAAGITSRSIAKLAGLKAAYDDAVRRSQNGSISAGHEAAEIARQMDAATEGVMNDIRNFKPVIRYEGTSTTPKAAGAGGGTDSAKETEKHTKTALELFQDWFSSLFDWIEVKLEKQTDKISRYVSDAERALDSGKYASSAKSYRKAVNATAAQISYKETAAGKYENHAGKVLEKAVSMGVISQSEAAFIKKTVKSGSMDISEYSDKVREVIKDYQDWSTKAQNTRKSVSELHDNIREYIKDLKDVRDAQRDAKLDTAGTFTDIGTSGIAISKRTQNSQLKFKNNQLKRQNNAYKTETAKVSSDVKAVGKTGTSAISNALKSSKDKKYRKALQNAKKAIKAKKAVSGSDLKMIKARSADIYNKLYAYNLALDNLETAKLEQAANYAATSAEIYRNIAETYSNEDDKTNDKISLYKQKAANETSASRKNDYLEQVVTAYKKIVTDDEKEVMQYKKTANSKAKTIKNKAGTTSKYKKLNSKTKAGVKKAVNAAKSCAKKGTAIKSTTLSNLAKYYSEGYVTAAFYQACINYNNALESKEQAEAQKEIDIETAEAEKVDISYQKFNNIAGEYEKKVQMSDYQMKALDNNISEIETAGKKVDRSYYDAQKKINDQKLAQYQAEKSELEESIGTIKKGTDEWYEAYDRIQQVSSSISDCVKETYNLNNAINQLHFDMFNDIAESIDRIIAEQEFLQGLFAHEKTTDSETGMFTEAGIARLGSLSASYYASNEKAEKDSAEIQKLKNILNKGINADGTYGDADLTFNSLDDLQAKIDETYTTWQNDIKETYSIESEIADLMKEKYQAELDMLQELINARKEALQSKKDLHDYQKTLNEKTTDINTIKKQIAAYMGDSSQEALAKVQKLQKELADKEEDLRETEYDRYISDQQDMLDKLYTEYEELITKKLDDFKELVEEGLTTANDNLSGINNYLSSVATENGYTEETKGLFNGVTKGIEENVGKIITAIEGNATANSVTVSDTGSADSAADNNPITTNRHSAVLFESLFDTLTGNTQKHTLSSGGIITPLEPQIVSTEKLTQHKIQELFTSEPAVHNLTQSPVKPPNTSNLVPARNNISAGDMVFNIDLPNVRDSAEFVRAIQTDHKLQNAIRSVSTERLTGEGRRLNVNQIL